MKHVFVAALLFLLVACVPKGPPHVTVSTDEFNPNFDIDGPMQRTTVWATLYRWQLHSLVDKKTYEVTHALYFDTDYSGTKDPLVSAYDDHAQPLILLRLHTDKGICNPAVHSECEYTEKAEVLLNEAYLKGHATTGFKIKISTRDGDWYVLPITPQMIKLQLDATKQYAHAAH